MKRLLSIAKNTFDSDYAAILLLLAFSAALFAPAAFLGIPQNYDLGQHLRFAQTWHDAIAGGNFLPSWGAADNAGLGSAGIRFYPPVTHFVLAVTQFVTGSWYDTLWVTMLGWMFIGSVGVFKLASEWSSRSIAFGSAVLYVLVPYHLLQVFQAFFLAEFAAAAVLPFCFLYAHRLLTKGDTINVLLFAASYSALVLTHIPTTIMGTLSLAVFVLGFVSAENFFRVALRFASAFAISLAATAFFWVRMVSELSWVKHNTPEYFASGVYNYSVHFFPMLYSAGEAYWARFLWLFDISILATCALCIPALIVVFRKKFDAPRHLISLLAVAGFALFMMSVVSAPVWDNISLIQKLQFPFRWLSPASLAAALLFPLGAAAVVKNRTVITRPFAYGLASALMFVIVLDVSQIIVPSAPVPREEVAKAIRKLDKEPGCECWWPIWASRDATKNVVPAAAGDREFVITRWESTDRRFTVNAGSAESVRVGTFFYPHWRATVNGAHADVSPDPHGLIEVPIPPEAAEVMLEFHEPPIVVASRYISAVTLAAIFLFLLFTIGSFKKSLKQPRKFVL
ncbi:MAG TPA: 6-pyruvoyl-tetrahydropterin synthase-related protein [Pyrinomonadaceae bacterium]|nr:6-pyruvoyl-tetrahydropterin synthase-related protein [Pyrinomonadaceae bacterium]